MVIRCRGDVNDLQCRLARVNNSIVLFGDMIVLLRDLSNNHNRQFWKDLGQLSHFNLLETRYLPVHLTRRRMKDTNVEQDAGSGGAHRNRHHMPNLRLAKVVERRLAEHSKTIAECDKQQDGRVGDQSSLKDCNVRGSCNMLYYRKFVISLFLLELAYSRVLLIASDQPEERSCARTTYTRSDGRTAHRLGCRDPQP